MTNSTNHRTKLVFMHNADPTPPRGYGGIDVIQERVRPASVQEIAYRDVRVFNNACSQDSYAYRLWQQKKII